MKRPVFALLIFAGALCAQTTGVVFSPDTPATTAQPGSMVMTDATAGAPTLACTITANIVPATAVIISCTDNGTEVDNDTVTFVAGMAYTVSLTQGANSVIALLSSCLPVSGATAPAACGTTTAGIAVSAVSHAAAPVAQGIW
jgi:hypothetical protein